MAERLTDLLFEPLFYARQSGARGDKRELRRHFDKAGRHAGLSPGPLFDARWYGEFYDDVQAEGIAPYDHFVKWGSAEGRNPNPIFDAAWVRATLGKAGQKSKHPLVRFIEANKEKDIRPHPLFWSDWYRKTQMAGARGDPLTHYLTEGWQADASPCPLFDPAYFAECHLGHLPGVRNPLAHFIAMSRDDPAISPHPLFDARAYLRGLKSRGIGCQGSALAHYLTSQGHGDLPDPHPLFDTAFYVGQRRGQGDGPPLVDYLDLGPTAMIDPNPFFSKRVYLEGAPDVLAAGVDALEHYVRAGDREGRKFHALIDPRALQSARQSEATALETYLTAGAAAGAALRPIETPDRRLRAPSPLRRVISVPRTGRLLSGLRTTGEVGIFAHTYHLDCAHEMILAANNAPADRTRLFISTVSVGKAQALENLCQASAMHPFEIRVLPNRGRDIAPFIVGFADRLREVDFGLHIHSKKSAHYAGGLDRWRAYLLDQNLGSADLVGNILDILAAPGIGAYCPDHFDPVRDLIQWGGNFDCAKALMEMMGETLKREARLEFPSGSMFWFRAQALDPLLGCNLRFEHFEAEAGQTDGTLAHAIERLFLGVVAVAGFAHVTGVASETAQETLTADQIWRHGNRLTPVRRDGGPAAAHYPHAAGYLGVPSPIDRPRINLLVPTADRGRAYGGVSTALDVFGALRTALGGDADARIIATDVAPLPHLEPLPGCALSGLDAADQSGRDTLVAGTDRDHLAVALRRQDIFVATAWWTAHQTRMLMQRQAELFGAAPARWVYIIQDFENGFQPWSTEWSLADATYRDPAATIPIFNTPILFDDFRAGEYFEDGHVLYPAINREFAAALDHERRKERLVLLYARPHAARNCLEFLDMAVVQARRSDPALWRDWRFLAIGEDFAPHLMSRDSGVEVLGRLDIADYAELASRAALAVSLMVSPHPSYPPLEMAAAGVRVLTNRFGARDSAALHENIESFGVFDAGAVADQLTLMARRWSGEPQAGWRGQAKVTWFFDGQTNLDELARTVAAEIRSDLRLDASTGTHGELRLLPAS